MKKAFMCSLCRDGLLGGGLYIDNLAITYKTQKLTVSEKYRNLKLPLSEIEKIYWKWAVFPVAVFYMKNGESYKFIIFNKKGFDSRFKQCGENILKS